MSKVGTSFDRFHDTSNTCPRDDVHEDRISINDQIHDKKYTVWSLVQDNCSNECTRGNDNQYTAAYQIKLIK